MQRVTYTGGGILVLPGGHLVDRKGADVPARVVQEFLTTPGGKACHDRGTFIVHVDAPEDPIEALRDRVKALGINPRNLRDPERLQRLIDGASVRDSK